jgi:L-asparaginase II
MKNHLPTLVEVRRGPIVESRHRGAIVIAEPDGRIVNHLGDASHITSTRSTIKPIQAIPFITSGAADHFDVDQRELAVVCASHEGEPIHTETVAGMLVRAGFDESALLCGAHPPYDTETARKLEERGEHFTQLHNNCSGKHTGMLLTAGLRGFSTGDYVSIEHPVQQQIIRTFRQLASLEGDLPAAIDGCSAPTFGVPLSALAVAFARLVNPAQQESAVANAAGRIVTAMINHPEMVGGTKGRFDTELLRASHGKLVCKIGAEASYAVGVLPCERFPRGVGIAFKIEDGSYRGLGPAVVEALAQLEILNEAETGQLASFHRPETDNRRGARVGQVRAVFQL